MISSRIVLQNIIFISLIEESFVDDILTVNYEKLYSTFNNNNMIAETRSLDLFIITTCQNFYLLVLKKKRNLEGKITK